MFIAENPGHEPAELFERLEASRRAGRDMLHAAHDVGGIRVNGKLHDESAARRGGDHAAILLPAPVQVLKSG